MDHALIHAQVGRISESTAGTYSRLRFRAQADIPAIVNRDKTAGVDATKSNPPGLFVVTIARVHLAEPMPRTGEHFTDQAGKILRITEDRTVPFHPTLVFACVAST